MYDQACETVKATVRHYHLKSGGGLGIFLETRHRRVRHARQGILLAGRRRYYYSKYEYHSYVVPCYDTRCAYEVRSSGIYEYVLQVRTKSGANTTGAQRGRASDAVTRRSFVDVSCSGCFPLPACPSDRFVPQTTNGMARARDLGQRQRRPRGSPSAGL